MNKVTPFLMFNDQLEAAIEFYTATFPDSEVRNVARTLARTAHQLRRVRRWWSTLHGLQRRFVLQLL
jgi:predicted 3-demethylubiquinone-9 3-methyltransferase (glyoxalase superfamily)